MRIAVSLLFALLATTTFAEEQYSESCGMYVWTSSACPLSAWDSHPSIGQDNCHCHAPDPIPASDPPGAHRSPPTPVPPEADCPPPPPPSYIIERDPLLATLDPAEEDEEEPEMNMLSSNNYCVAINRGPPNAVQAQLTSSTDADYDLCLHPRGGGEERQKVKLSRCATLNEGEFTVRSIRTSGVWDANRQLYVLEWVPIQSDVNYDACVIATGETTAVWGLSTWARAWSPP